MKRILFFVIYLFCCFNIFCQDTIDNLDMFLSHRYITSTNELYIYIEISIWNRNIHNIYILKNYDVINIVEEEDGIILILSSWIDQLDYLKYTSAMYHNPPMVEIRHMQRAYLSLLLKIPVDNMSIDRSKTIKQIVGFKYSLNQYITEDISWASNVNEFASGIRQNVNDLVFNYNKYSRKYGNSWISPLQPPDWLLGTWVTDRYFNEKEVSNNDRLIFLTDNIIHFWRNLNEFFFMSIYDKMEQNIYENNYNITLIEDEGRIWLINYKLEGEYLIVEDYWNNEIYSYILRKR